jgi:hypothetical protein
VSASLAPGDIDRSRARLENARSAKGTGDEVALDFALARDACALSAHCAAVEASRVALRCYNLVGGASYFRSTEPGRWGFDDSNLDSDVRGASVFVASRARLAAR